MGYFYKPAPQTGFLNDEYEAASKIMLEISKKGTFLQEVSYHTWPLFRDFRGTTDFLEAYHEIYGHEFVAELQKEVAQTEKELSTEDGAANNSNGRHESHVDYGATMSINPTE